MSQAHEPHPTERERLTGRWRELGSSFGITPAAVRRARLELLVVVPLYAVAILLWVDRVDLLGLPNCVPGSGTRGCGGMAGPTALQIGVALILILAGWQMGRDFGRALTPYLFRRLDAGTAGTAGFLIRLVTLIVTLIVALRIANVSVTAIAIGASFSAVVIGLAAQQTLGNLIAGIVLITARPFRVGDTVRLQVGMLAGTIEGVVTQLGLMYTTFDPGGDPVMVPNSAVLAAAVRPLREPEAVSLRARVRDGRSPVELQEAIERRLSVPIRRHPRVALEEVDGSDVIVTITVSPRNRADGTRLATDLLEAVTSEVGDQAPDGSARSQPPDAT